MSNLMKGKVFGLSMPKKSTMAPHLHNVIPKAMEKSKMAKPSIFGAEESSDSDDGGDWVKKAMMTKKETKLKATTKNEMAAALEEDPTVFQYDEVYDKLEQKKEEEKESKKSAAEKDRKPKYMDRLLATAKEREQEFERRQERAAQREREKEGDMYADKEKFVTSAFRCFIKCLPYQARARSARARRACALRALGLLLADGTPTVGGGKTF